MLKFQALVARIGGIKGGGSFRIYFTPPPLSLIKRAIQVLSVVPEQTYPAVPVQD